MTQSTTNTNITAKFGRFFQKTRKFIAWRPSKQHTDSHTGDDLLKSFSNSKIFIFMLTSSTLQFFYVYSM